MIRGFLALILALVLIPAIVGCQGESGPAENAPARWEPEEYTQYLVKEAIGSYEAQGRDATLAYYNTPESIDGQWYVLIFDENDVMLAHAANPALVGQPASKVVGPNDYPTGEAVVGVADEDGEWFSYTYTNPSSGAVEAKHSWMVEVDGLTFGSGWYERGPKKSNGPEYTQAFVERAMNLYDAIGLEDTVAYYNTTESIDGQWYTFILDEDDTILALAPLPQSGRAASLGVAGAQQLPCRSGSGRICGGEWGVVQFQLHQPGFRDD